MSLNDCYAVAGRSHSVQVRLITKAARSLIKFSRLKDYLVKV